MMSVRCGEESPQPLTSTIAPAWQQSLIEAGIV